MAYITNPKTPNTHKTHTPPPPTYHVVFSSYIASTPTNSSI